MPTDKTDIISKDLLDSFSGIDTVNELMSGLDGTVVKIDRALKQIEQATITMDVKAKTALPEIGEPRPIVQPVETDSEAPPQIQHIDVVLREGLPEGSCRESKKYSGVKLCLSKDGQVTKYRYDTDAFERVTGADLNRIQEKVNKCPLCKASPTTALKGERDLPSSTSPR